MCGCRLNLGGDTRLCERQALYARTRLHQGRSEPAGSIVCRRVRFDSLADRDAAQRSFETSHRRHIGLGNAWTLGPYLLTVDGSQQQGAIERLQQALQSLGAQ